MSPSPPIAPGAGPREKTIRYRAPWVRCDREKDYEVAWRHFARRFGTEETKDDEP